MCVCVSMVVLYRLILTNLCFLVGVIGSGRGMTGFQQRGKHQYTDNVEEE